LTAVVNVKTGVFNAICSGKVTKPSAISRQLEAEEASGGFKGFGECGVGVEFGGKLLEGVGQHLFYQRNGMAVWPGRRAWMKPLTSVPVPETLFCRLRNEPERR
jgi:hypothetical protein